MDPTNSEYARIVTQFSGLNTQLEDKPVVNASIPAFYAVSPQSVRCCPSVEDFHAGRNISHVPLAEFVKTRNFKEYNPSLHVSASQIQQVWADNQFPQNPVTELEEQLYDPHYTDRFVVVNMGVMGDGLFLAHDAKPIKAGSIVLIYSGEYCKDDSRIGDYGLQIDPAHDHEYNSVLMKRTALPHIDGFNGNLARLVQGGLDQVELDSKEISSNDLLAKKVAIAGLQQRVVLLRGFPLACLQAWRDFSPGQIVTFSYGLDYFKLRKIDFLVTDDYGRVIAKVSNKALLALSDVSQLPDAARIDYRRGREIMFTPFTTQMVFDYQKQFYHSVCHAFSAALTILPTYDHRRLLEKFLGEFQKTDKPTEQYSKLQEYFKVPELKCNELLFLRRHLLKLATEFHKNHASAIQTKTPAGK